jgi:hypothetical protein
MKRITVLAGLALMLVLRIAATTLSAVTEPCGYANKCW